MEHQIRQLSQDPERLKTGATIHQYRKAMRQVEARSLTAKEQQAAEAHRANLQQQINANRIVHEPKRKRHPDAVTELKVAKANWKAEQKKAKK